MTTLWQIVTAATALGSLPHRRENGRGTGIRSSWRTKCATQQISSNSRIFSKANITYIISRIGKKCKLFRNRRDNKRVLVPFEGGRSQHLRENPVRIALAFRRRIVDVTKLANTVTNPEWRETEGAKSKSKGTVGECKSMKTKCRQGSIWLRCTQARKCSYALLSEYINANCIHLYDSRWNLSWHYYDLSRLLFSNNTENRFIFERKVS